MLILLNVTYFFLKTYSDNYYFMLFDYLYLNAKWFEFKLYAFLYIWNFARENLNSEYHRSNESLYGKIGSEQTLQLSITCDMVVSCLTCHVMNQLTQMLQ